MIAPTVEFATRRVQCPSCESVCYCTMVRQPVVAAVFWLRALREDPTCDSAVTLCSLCKALPFVGLPLAYAQSLDPDERMRDLGFNLPFDRENLGRVDGLAHALLQRRVLHHRQINPDGELSRGWSGEGIGPDEPPSASLLEPGAVDALQALGEHAADALSAPTLKERVTISRALFEARPLLAVLVAARNYRELTPVNLTGAAAEAYLAERRLRPPASAGPLRILVSLLLPPEMGDLLGEWAPEVKAWLDFRLPIRNPESLCDPRIRASIESMAAWDPSWRLVHKSLPNDSPR